MKDVNGTRHHLLFGREDWQCSTSPAGADEWFYDDHAQLVTLTPQLFEFPEVPGDPAFVIADRRGAARDRYGHWYWIGPDETSIRVRWSEGNRGEHYWSAADVRTCEPVSSGVFGPVQSPLPPAPERLAGLVATSTHYLIVGAPDSGELLVFDLHTGGQPTRLSLPLPPGAEAGEHTEPFDMAPLPDGGFVVLDRTHKLVWVYDATLRPAPPPTLTPGDLLLFQPETLSDGLGERRAAPTGQPEPINLPDSVDPVSVEPLPDGSLLVLDRADATFATVRRYAREGAPALASVPLQEAHLREPDEPSLQLVPILAHDMAFVPWEKTLEADAHAGDHPVGVLYVVEAAGNQVYALDVWLGSVGLTDGLILRAQRRYFPLRSYTGKALVAPPGAEHPYFDQGDRWLPIVALGRPRYARAATLDLPVMDGREPECVWHRICLDACIPPETSVQVWTRAAQDADDLAWQEWQAEPLPYLRGRGAELPNYNLWSAAERAQPHTGTWETLCQQARGRYLQIRLELRGNGRTTPKIRALRAHYPRFSYLERYMPAVYRDDPTSASFLERFLANPEGLLTTLEGIIADAQVFWDVHTAPTEALEWLAGWIGLVLDPTWTEYQRRLLIAHTPEFYRRRGTVTGLIQILRLAIEPEAGPAIFQEYDDYCYGQGPCSIAGTSTLIRIIERFRTRRMPAVALGDPTETGTSAASDPLTIASERAHRFTVLLPVLVCESGQVALGAAGQGDLIDLATRLVEMEKPAHTYFSVKRYWAAFRVGEVRVGLDTRLGYGGRFELFRLGETALAEGALGAAYPSNVTDRTVLNQ